MKRDVETVLTYPAVMGSVFVLALQAGVPLGRGGRGGLRRVACVVVVLAALKSERWLDEMRWRPPQLVIIDTRQPRSC